MGPNIGRLAGFLIGLAALFPSVGLAELPPSAYEKMQAAAPEKVELRVMRVEVEPGTNPDDQVIRITAIAEKVDRTVTGIKDGDFLTITYTVVARPPGWVGPGAFPILNEKDKTLAYLHQIPDSADYEPVAGAMSFSDF